MKVDDIRPDSVMANQDAAMNHDVDWLAQRRDSFVPVPCPACAGKGFHDLYEKYGMQHVACDACGTQYVNPRPPAKLLAEFYAQSKNYAFFARHVFPASKEARRTQIFRPRASRTAEIFSAAGKRGGTLVEVGAAFGLYCEEVKALDTFDRIIGIEPTPDLAQICRSLGIETIESSYEHVKLDKPVSMIAAFEVIEHLFDPGHFLRWCHDTLEPDGVVLVTCPNIRGFETLMLGRESGAVDHEHINLFHPDSLSLLFERCGFELLEVSTPGELDVDIVRRALESNDVTGDVLGPVLAMCIDDSRGESFQRFLSANRMSSNLRVAARRRHETRFVPPSALLPVVDFL